ncbi:unnamed protein product, partial [Rangifer tarandus platyrhynchus]
SPSTKTSYRLHPQNTSRTFPPHQPPALWRWLSVHRHRPVCSAQSLLPAGTQWSSPDPAHQETRPPRDASDPTAPHSAQAPRSYLLRFSTVPGEQRSLSKRSTSGEHFPGAPRPEHRAAP